MKLGECLEAYREKNNLTWRSLAKEIRVDRAVLCRLKNQPTLGGDNTMRILNWLMTKENHNHEP